MEPAGRVRPLRWDIYEEHLDEASFLWGEWEKALEGAVYTLDDVAIGPEERLCAHLDGLVLGGRPVAEKMLLPALAGDEIERLMPAAWALLAAEDVDHLDAVLGALAGAEPPRAAALARVLGLSKHPALVPRLTALWEGASASLRAVVLKVVGLRDMAWSVPRLFEALATKDPVLRAEALRLLRFVPDPDPALRWYIDQELESDDAGLRDEAVATGLVWQVRGVWKRCRRAVADGTASRLMFGVLALSPDPKDRAALRDRLGVPDTAAHVLWALGFAGDADAADVLVGCLREKATAPLAGDSFAAITGLPIEGVMREPGVRHGPDEEEGEVGADDPPPVVHAEDLLPLPAWGAVAEWWKRNRARFPAGQRFVGGVPREPESLRAALTHASMWRRRLLALEWTAAVRGGVPVDVSTWAREQQRVLSEPAASASRMRASRAPR